MDEEKAAHLLAAMRHAFPEALVHGYAHLIPSMRNDEGDRHVVAAAVHAGAQLIVTRNLRHFRHLPDGIEAQDPDDFLLDLFDLAPATIVELLERQAAALKRPPVEFSALLAGLGKTVPRFEEAVRARCATKERG